MANYVALDPLQHARTSVSAQQAAAFAATQHLLNVRVTEVAQLACDLPLFITKTAYGQWALSALCSVVPAQNLWVTAAEWQATHVPAVLQTYPLCALPGSEQGELKLGIFTDGTEQTAGMALFDANLQPTDELARRRKLVETDLQHEYLTYTFLKQLTDLQLLRHVELVLTTATEEQRIQGLHTINEDRLATLSAEQLKALQQQGLLMPIHAMLLSLLQLNRLIKKHNSSGQAFQLKHIKLAVAK
jgi:hypothetical protein